MSNKIKLLSRQLMLFNTLFLVIISSQAYAESRRAHAGECHTSDDTDGTDVYNISYFVNTDESFQVSVYCNVPTDSSLEFTEVTRLNIHGYNSPDDPAYAYSKVCYYNLYTDTMSCGASKTWGEGFQAANDVDTSIWLAQANASSKVYSMPYIYTSLGPGARIHGYYFSD